ncbi:hypothetical protein QFC24_006836 [Naganishia onofrii]|uniref:Uncharacterized protein n=1 Tax=Naganishia onofrii TaxID=1851511 RepID=A0ACC2WXW5_9TREE|nr:hypothetical protein QFC24_006836 [Naganishia onofrii]
MQAIHAPLIPQTGITHVLFLRQFTASAKFDNEVVGNVVVAGGERVRVYDLLVSRQEKGEAKGLRMRKVWDQRGAGEVTGLQSVRLVGTEGEKVVVAWGAKAPGAARGAQHAKQEDVRPLTMELNGSLLQLGIRTFILTKQRQPFADSFISSLSAFYPRMVRGRSIDCLASHVRESSASELSPTLRNVKDLVFLPGFNNPTLAILFSPVPTATGRATVPRDTYHIEIRTLDPLGQTYPLISSTEDLPSDSEYIVPCPQDIGGVLLVTATAVFHVDQSGKYVCTSSNGWFKFVSNITPTKRREECLLELDGSHVVWADEGNFLMVLRDSTVIQARLEVEGRAVVGIDFLSPLGPAGMESASASKIGLRLGLEQPSSVCEIALPPSEEGRTRSAFFATSAVGDSCLVTVDMVPEETLGGEAMNGINEAKPEVMDVDLDDELTRAERKLMQAHLSVTAKVQGIGYISDMTFGVTPESKSARELVPDSIPATREPEIAILQGGGKGSSTVDLVRPQLRTTKKRKYQELVGSANVWAVRVNLDVESLDQPQETVTRLFQAQTDDDGSFGSTYVWAVDSDTGELQEVLTTYEEETIAVGACLNASRIARVSTYAINLLDADGGLDTVESNHMDTSNGTQTREGEDEPLRIEQICISNIGNKDNVRPYLMLERANKLRDNAELGLYIRASDMYRRAISVPYQLYNDECEPVPGPEAVPNLTPAMIERSTLELFDPYSWTVVDGYEFDENEVVLCVENMVLEATSTEAGVKRYLVVGTSVNRGEDMSSKGNTYVFEIIEVIGGVDQNGWSLRLICTEEARGPVSALANVGQYMVQAMGQKVYVKALDKEDHLVPVAFLDVPPYITSIKVFKNLILLGDIVKGVWLAVFQETPFRLDVIAKDFYDVSVVAVDFLASEGMITFSTVDGQGDLRLLEFNPDQSSSNEVAKLVRRTEYHIGQPVTKSVMVARRKTVEDRIAPQTQIIYADTLGGLSTLIPVKAARFKRLQLLQGQVTRSVQHMAGLNPKAYRHVANPYQARALNKGVLDGFLLQTFIDLPFDKQKELVDPIGTNRETIINDLVDLSFTW